MIARRRVSVLIFTICGLYLVGLGLYFALFRPALLPEDSRYIGGSLAQTQAALPGIERWLDEVFDVMGGFMAGTRLLTSYLATTAVSARGKGTGVVLALVGLATVGTMSWMRCRLLGSLVSSMWRITNAANERSFARSFPLGSCIRSVRFATR